MRRRRGRARRERSRAPTGGSSVALSGSDPSLLLLLGERLLPGKPGSDVLLAPDVPPQLTEREDAERPHDRATHHLADPVFRHPLDHALVATDIAGGVNEGSAGIEAGFGLLIRQSLGFPRFLLPGVLGLGGPLI